MQLGYVLVLLALLAGTCAALWEDTRTETAWYHMVVCGFFTGAAGYDIGLNPQETVGLVGWNATHVIIWFLWSAAIVIETAALVWLVIGAWRMVCGK